VMMVVTMCQGSHFEIHASGSTGQCQTCLDVKISAALRLDMPYINTNKLPVIERLPGWRGRYFDSSNMTFAHYEFDADSSIHEHSHLQEEVYEVIEGELEITINGVTKRLIPGIVGIVPPSTLHSVKAISSGKVIVVDYPLRKPPGKHS